MIQESDAIIIESLVKYYKKNKVLDNINYSFKEKKTYILVGANGSGKSTLIKVILGIVNKTSGKVIIKAKRIGYIPERFYFPDFCSIKSFLKSVNNIHNIDDENKIKDYCDYFNLDENKMINSLSKGMMQKILIIQAFASDADVIIMDESLNGLDDEMQEKFLSLIRYMKRNKTIIISTHYQEYYKDIYDIKLKLNNGKLYEENS